MFRDDIAAALDRAEALKAKGRWVRVTIHPRPQRVAPDCYVALEWGDIDGGIDQKALATEWFDERGESIVNHHL